LIVTIALCEGFIHTSKVNKACPSNPLDVGQTRIETRHDNLNREYVVHIPRGYNNTFHIPLVFDVHGYTNTAEMQARLSGMRDIADDNMFVVVNPEGTGALQSWNGGDCCVGNREDDVGFFLRMIEEVSEEYACIDLTRVYSGGWSNGGFMSHYLACETDALAAIAPVAGTITLPCNTGHATPLWHIHGTDDRTIPYEGNFAYEGAEMSWDRWAEINGCTAQEEVVYDFRQTECVSRYNCNGSRASVLCTIDGGAHDYDFTDQGMNSAEHSWEFYRQFRNH
jgi:polyhydroxybutyrate depolymerase